MSLVKCSSLRANMDSSDQPGSIWKRVGLLLFAHCMGQELELGAVSWDWSGNTEEQAGQERQED